LEKKINTNNTEIVLKAKYVEKKIDTFIIEFSWTPAQLSFAEILHYFGAIPLPPYIKREVEISDTERYQTVYANQDGSVAAPTAGLHFTNALFEKLERKKIKRSFITLHVGAGTFKPVKTEKIGDHILHAEWIDVPKETIEDILQNLNNPIIAVGTTSLRTIESLYWMGAKLSMFDSRGLTELTQWEAYDLIKNDIQVEESLQSLLNWMNRKNLKRLITRTQLIIAPGYKPKIAKALITNFHMPQSTLLLLVAAVTGNVQKTGQPGWRKIYDYALQQNFRFLSYGDGSLLWFS
jgi:S-adenosylmethionine:tRNA ribosyltransferase-isomerase